MFKGLVIRLERFTTNNRVFITNSNKPLGFVPLNNGLSQTKRVLNRGQVVFQG